MTQAITVGDLVDVLSRIRRAQHAADQILAHGPGLTFGALAIGECFEWPPPIPCADGGEPLVKTSDVGYAWSRGTGTAEAFYRVERWTGGTG
ncbi:MAG: hypothetical protein ABJA98_01585 [Acidobacteriota bacterium]